MLRKLDIGNVFHSKWLNCVKDILLESGYIQCWNDQYVPKNICLSNNVKKYYCDCFIEKWKDQVFNSH